MLFQLSVNCFPRGNKNWYLVFLLASSFVLASRGISLIQPRGDHKIMCGKDEEKICFRIWNLCGKDNSIFWLLPRVMFTSVCKCYAVLSNGYYPRIGWVNGWKVDWNNGDGVGWNMLRASVPMNLVLPVLFPVLISGLFGKYQWTWFSRLPTGV